MIALFLIFSLAVPAQATPATPDATARVDLLLNSIDVLLSPMAIAQVGLTEDYAVAVATDSTRRRYLRVRATGALAMFGSARGRSVLLELARDDTDVEVRIQAVTSLVYWFAEDAPGQLAAALVAIADHAPPMLRKLVMRRVRQLPR
ncbi:MAG: hypothetical protein ACI9U2_000481 [Bradymonadia bacterium]|jgi:hypothetical protein